MTTATENRYIVREHLNFGRGADHPRHPNAGAAQLSNCGVWAYLRMNSQRTCHT